MTETQGNPLAKEFHVCSLIRFAFPSMVMMLFMGLYTTVDTVFVARFVNTDALSAINIVCPVINLTVGLGTMLAAGGSAVVAGKMGSGNAEEARQDFTRIVLAGILTGLLIMTAGLSAMDEIVRWLGASGRLAPYCRDYLRILLIFSVGNMMQVLYQNLIITAGRPGLGLLLSVLAGTANIAFDYLFIVLLKMGIQGAALGTGAGYLIPAIAGTVFFWKGRSELHFVRPGKGWQVLAESCLNGASEMVSQLSAAVTTFSFNAVMMRLLGEDGVAAITVLIYTQFLLTTLYIGFSMGIAPVISYAYGSGQSRQLKRVIRIGLGFVGMISLLLFLVSCLGGEGIARLYAGEQERVFALTSSGFRIFSVSFLFSGYNIFASALFTALSDGRSSALLSFSRTFGFLMLYLLVLPGIFMETGVWAAVPAAEGSAFLLTVWLMSRRRRAPAAKVRASGRQQ